MLIKVRYNIIFVFISMIMTILLMPLRNEVFSSVTNVTLSIIAISNVLIFWKTSSKINNHWIRFEILFLIGFLIVNFQIPFSASLGWEPDNPAFIWINKNVVNYATWLSTISLLFWILGYLISVIFNRNNNFNIKKKKIFDLSILLKRIKTLIIILFPLFLVLVGQDFLQGKYDGGENWGAGASYIYLLLHSALVIYLVVFFKYNRFKMKGLKAMGMVILKNKIPFFILISYILIFLLAGDRGPVIQIGIVVAFMFSFTQMRIKGRTFVVFIFIAAIIMSVVKMGRMDPSLRSESNIFTEGYKNFSETEQFNPTLELASSNRILFRALDVVPSSHPYLYGTTMMGDIISGIPFGARTLFPILELPKPYTSSTNFFTFIGQGSFSTWGEGSQLIADIYINLGIYGVMFLMFLFGVLICRLSFSLIYSNNLFVIIVYSIFTMLSIYLNRATFFTVMQPLIITAILYLTISFNARKYN